MEVVIIFLALLVGYLLLRSRGGEGLNIRFDLGPASTSKGRANRLVLGAALAIWSAGLIFVIVNSQGDTRASVITSLTVGAIVGLAFLVPYINNKAKK